MNITVNTSRLHDASVEAAIAFVFEDKPLQDMVHELDTALGGAIHDVIATGDITGKIEQTVVLYPRGVVPAQRVIVVGLGEQEIFTVDRARRAAAQGLRKARELKAKTAVIGMPNSAFPTAEIAGALAEGALLGLYSFHGQKSKEPDTPLPELL